MHAQVVLDLPTALLARVLERVPTQHRLSQCALVCQHFAAAAAIATSSISICSRRCCYYSTCTERDCIPSSKLPLLQAWVEQHAGQLTSISYCGKHQLQLPCAGLLQLVSLELEGQMLLQEDSASTSTHAAGGTSTGAAGMLLRSGKKKSVGQCSSTPMQQLLPKLQRLELSRCELSSVQPLEQLSRLTSLTSLNLGSLTLAIPTGQSVNAQLAQAPADVLSVALSTFAAASRAEA